MQLGVVGAVAGVVGISVRSHRTTPHHTTPHYVSWPTHLNLINTQAARDAAAGQAATKKAASKEARRAELARTPHVVDHDPSQEERTAAFNKLADFAPGHPVLADWERGAPLPHGCAIALCPNGSGTHGQYFVLRLVLARAEVA